MKYLRPATVAAAALSMSTAPLYAGGAAAPLMEPEVLAPEVVVEEAAASSANGFILPLIFLALVAAAMSSSDAPRE